MKHRLAPLSDADWPVAIADMKAGFAGGLNVYRVMAHHPDLLRAWAPLRAHVVHHPSLGPQMSEVAILRTGHRLESSYEWQQHIERARRRGLDDTRIASIAGPLKNMAPTDALVAGAVDELLDTHALSAATSDALHNALGSQAVLDLMATVGFYSVLAWTLNTFSVPLDDDVAEALRDRPFDP